MLFFPLYIDRFRFSFCLFFGEGSLHCTRGSALLVYWFGPTATRAFYLSKKKKKKKNCFFSCEKNSLNDFCFLCSLTLFTLSLSFSLSSKWHTVQNDWSGMCFFDDDKARKKRKRDAGVGSSSGSPLSFRTKCFLFYFFWCQLSPKYLSLRKGGRNGGVFLSRVE